MVEAVRSPGLAGRLYNWVVGWAQSPYGFTALVVLALMESSFFPVPPDVLLIALAVAQPRRAFRFALGCSVGSVVGGLLGYYIGYALMETVGRSIIEFYSAGEQYAQLQALLRRWDFWVVFTAGFTPIPYKVFTISAGAFHLNILTFTLASIIGRSARFFLVGWLIFRYGPRIKPFIEKHLNVLSVAFVVLLVGGFIAIKWFSGH